MARAEPSTTLVSLEFLVEGAKNKDTERRASTTLLLLQKAPGVQALRQPECQIGRTAPLNQVENHAQYKKPASSSSHHHYSSSSHHHHSTNQSQPVLYYITTAKMP